MSSDAHRVATFGRGELWIGGAPPEGGGLAKAGFTELVFCAQEFQPPPADYPGLGLLYAPFKDNGDAPYPTELEIALGASRKVADAVRHGGKVLVTCWQGLNRSGLVTALSLMRLTGMPGRDAVAKVQRARPGSLKNPFFTDYLETRAVRRHVAKKH